MPSRTGRSQLLSPRRLLPVFLAATLACAERAPNDGRPGPNVAAGAVREAVAAETGRAARWPARDTGFAALVERLSEPGGYFDTDNLVSNEASYLHVVDAMERRGVRGGAYVGVGPDQNFSYIAAVRPEVAFLVDIRRDNLLQHLLYKALFHEARNRAEYLFLLTGRPLPADVARWTGRPLDAVLDAVAAAPADAEAAAAAGKRLRARVAAFGVPLDERDLAAIERIHRAFVAEGLELRFTSHGRPPRSYYPSFRQLVEERGRDGVQRSYLATEERFLVVQRLQRADRVIPVVGDLAGDHALAAIGKETSRRGLVVSAFYTSNVEYYLMREQTFDRFARTTAALPRDRRSVLVRSCFGYACGPSHPHAVSGYYSVQLLQSLDDFAALVTGGELRGYHDLVSQRLLPPA